MALGDAYRDDLLTAIADRAATPAAPSVPKFSAWSAIPRGIGEAGAQVGATLSDAAASFRYMRDATPEQRKQIDRQGVPIEQFSSAAGDSMRDAGKTLRPDPLTASTAETVLYGFARGAAKVVAGAVVGGVPGVLAAGLEEGITQSDELRRQGVDLKTRSNAGLVQGAGLALAALPAAGATLKSTAALYLAGGPGGFVAQQALTREILRNAGQDKLAEQYDPFDPVGLAVSALIPAPFAFYGLRASKRAAAARAAEDFRAGPVPSEQTPVAGAVREAYAPETVDAAMVLHAQQARAASSIGRADDLQASAAHETAMARAEDQMARGERVSVADVAPARITPAERDANFKAWFGDSKVVGEDGAPMVLYHGTTADFSVFAQSKEGWLGAGYYFADTPEQAVKWGSRHTLGRPEMQLGDSYESGAAGIVTMPVYLSVKNPASYRQVQEVIKALGDKAGDNAVRTELQRQGFDGAWDKMEGEIVVFAPEQVKSATGNSGRFDPASASLTDPLQNFADALDQVRRATTQEPARAPTAPQAPSPEAAAPARGAGDTPAPATAAEPGRAGADVQAAGVTPGAKAEAGALQMRMADVQAAHPDLQVMLDGMDKPMPLADFLAAVKAEADEMEADAPLMQVAAQCALLNGS